MLAAINHRSPERVPLDLGATPSSGISAIGHSNLMRYLGLQEPTLVYDVVQQLAQPSDALLDRFGVDVVDLGRTFNASPQDWHPITMANGAEGFYPQSFWPKALPDGVWGTYDDDGKRLLTKMPVGATFFDQVYFPYVDGYPADYRGLDAEMGRVLWARHGAAPWDHAGDPGYWDTLRENAIRLRESSERAILIGAGCNLFEWGTFLRRMDNFLMDLVCEEAQVDRLLDELMERHLASLAKICAAVGDQVDIIKFGDDLGMTGGPFMSPETYRRFFAPRHKILCDFVKKNSSAHTMLHSCGSIAALLPDLIGAGFEIINPVQTNAKGMDPRWLKKEFGADVTFWGGGVDTAATLNRGTPEEVRRQVLERLEIFSPGGGYVFNTVHNILPDVPPENIIAMYDAFHEFNK